MLTKEAMEKVAAADARDQAAAIDAGFEQACADMKLDQPHTEALAKVARARLAEFAKIANGLPGAGTVPPSPAPVAPKALPAVPVMPVPAPPKAVPTPGATPAEAGR